MVNDALIIFVRKPELGKVKTRLAATIGNEAALVIYKKLLEHTYTITSVLPCHKYVFYTTAVEEDDIWSKGYTKLVQANDDLGGRMKAAFACLFEKGHSRVCIVGSDCFELSAEIITKAFDLLDGSDLVIGPAKDGGYYLLGMRDDPKDVFEDIEWSTEKVFAQTLSRVKQHFYTCSLLPMLTDVDTINDVPEEWLAEL